MARSRWFSALALIGALVFGASTAALSQDAVTDPGARGVLSVAAGTPGTPIGRPLRVVAGTGEPGVVPELLDVNAAVFAGSQTTVATALAALRDGPVRIVSPPSPDYFAGQPTVTAISLRLRDRLEALGAPVAEMAAYWRYPGRPVVGGDPNLPGDPAVGATNALSVGWVDGVQVVTFSQVGDNGLEPFSNPLISFDYQVDDQYGFTVVLPGIPEAVWGATSAADELAFEALTSQQSGEIIELEFLGEGEFDLPAFMPPGLFVPPVEDPQPVGDTDVPSGSENGGRDEAESGGGGGGVGLKVAAAAAAFGIGAVGVGVTRRRRSGGSPPAEDPTVPAATTPIAPWHGEDDSEPALQATIWIVGEQGRSIREVVQGDTFSIVAVAPDDGDVPDTLSVRLRVGREEDTVELSRVGSEPGTVRYRSNGHVLDAAWDFANFTVTDGIRMTISADGFRPFTGRGHTVRASAELTVALDYLGQAAHVWRGVVAALPALEEVGVDVTGYRETAEQFLQQLKITGEEIDKALGGDQWDKTRQAAVIAKAGVQMTPLDALEALRVGQEPFIAYRGASGYAGALWADVDEYQEEKRNGIESLLGLVTISSYRAFATVSGGDIWWTLATATDETGTDRDRREALRDMVIDYLAGRIADDAVAALMGGTDALKAAKRPPLAQTGQPVHVRAGRPGLGNVVAPSAQGIRGELVARFNSIANRFGVVLAMRPGNVDAMEWQVFGLSVKSTEIKAKTATETDLVIGGPTSSHVPGGNKSPVALVAYFDPQIPRHPNMTDSEWAVLADGGRRPDGISDEAWTAMKKDHTQQVVDIFQRHYPNGYADLDPTAVGARFAQRRHEYVDNADEFGALQADGKIEIRDGLLIDTGLYQGNDLPMTGDLDMFEVLGLNGLAVSKEKYQEVLAALKSDPDLLVVHGAHMRWPQDKPFAKGSKEEGIYLAIVNKHGWDEPVVLIGGFDDGLPRISYTAKAEGHDYPVVIAADNGRVLWDSEAKMIARDTGRPAPPHPADVSGQRTDRPGDTDATPTAVPPGPLTTRAGRAGHGAESTEQATSGEPADAVPEVEHDGSVAAVDAEGPEVEVWNRPPRLIGYSIDPAGYLDAHANQAVQFAMDEGELPVHEWIYVSGEQWSSYLVAGWVGPASGAYGEHGVFVNVHTLELVGRPSDDELECDDADALERARRWGYLLDMRTYSGQGVPDDGGVPIELSETMLSGAEDGVTPL